jgi:hypothetical protein
MCIVYTLDALNQKDSRIETVSEFKSVRDLLANPVYDPY